MKRKQIILFVIIVLILIGSAFTIYNSPAIMSRFYRPVLDEAILNTSIKMGQQYFLNNQTDQGNFVYEYDFVNDQIPKGSDSEVRQAGGLWGLMMTLNQNSDELHFAAARKGIQFFLDRSISNENGSFIVYDSAVSVGKTGTQAIFVLAYLDFVKALTDSTELAFHEKQLKSHVNFLRSLQRDDLHFHGAYYSENGMGLSSPSPYSDGEALLALLKYSRYYGIDSWKNKLLNTANVMYDDFVVKALEQDGDSPTTKGFYQWGSMSFYEIYDAGWSDEFVKKTIDMAHWMIDVHHTLWRTKNTAYAHEGILVSYEMAKRTGDKESMRKFGYVVDKALSKLISWQVRGPLENEYLKSLTTVPDQAIGGVMNQKNDRLLRIDVTQHQTHALQMAVEYIYGAN